MLRTRIITAVILIIVLLSALFGLPQRAWVLFTFAIALAAFWEWSRLAQFTGRITTAFLGASFLIGLVLIYLFLNDEVDPQQYVSSAATIVASLFWIIVAPLWLKFGWRPR